MDIQIYKNSEDIACVKLVHDCELRDVLSKIDSELIYDYLGIEPASLWDYTLKEKITDIFEHYDECSVSDELKEQTIELDFVEYRQNISFAELEKTDRYNLVCELLDLNHLATPDDIYEQIKKLKQ